MNWNQTPFVDHRKSKPAEDKQTIVTTTTQSGGDEAKKTPAVVQKAPDDSKKNEQREDVRITIGPVNYDAWLHYR
jgi:hypothetical protein